MSNPHVPAGASHGQFVDLRGVSAAEFEPVPSPEPDPTAAAFFDIDNTIMRGASIFHLARGLAKHDLLSTKDMAGFAWKQAKFLIGGNEDLDDMAQITEAGLAFVQGRHVDEMRSIADEVFEMYMVDKLWPGTLAIAQSHLDIGNPVWLVSASPIEVAEVIAERLGLTGAIGTTAQIADGRYTGRLDGPPMHGQAKADAVKELAAREGLELKKCSAYSDSSNDIPMLSLVGNPCAINPDHHLREHARTQGWQIRDYRSHRFALKIGVPMAAALGLLAGMTIGIAVARPVRRQVTPALL